MQQRRQLTFMGIDPSANAGGYCVRMGDEIVTGHCPVYELISLPWADWDADRVVVAVECPRWMYRGSNHVVRSAATQWVHVIKQMYPRRATLIPSYGKSFVDPQAWRAAILANMPGADWKAKALRYARLTAEDITNHNEAEALCIMEYARVAYHLRGKKTQP